MGYTPAGKALPSDVTQQITTVPSGDTAVTLEYPQGISNATDTGGLIYFTKTGDTAEMHEYFNPGELKPYCVQGVGGTSAGTTVTAVNVHGRLQV
jgi:hypothetical protein